MQIVVSSAPHGESFFIFTTTLAAKATVGRMRKTTKSPWMTLSRLVVGRAQPLQVAFFVAAGKNHKSQQRGGVLGEDEGAREVVLSDSLIVQFCTTQVVTTSL